MDWATASGLARGFSSKAEDIVGESACLQGVLAASYCTATEDVEAFVLEDGGEILCPLAE